MVASRGSPRRDGAVALLVGCGVGALVWLGLLVSGHFTTHHVLLVFAVPGAVLAAGRLLRARPGARRGVQRTRPRGLSGIGGSTGASSRSPS
jgi:hypothetical protein